MWNLRSLSIAALLTLLTIAGVPGLEVRPGFAQSPAIISNGTVQMGINPEGHLNVGGGTPSSQTGNTVVGLRFVPTNAEATADGCLCEGWGAADAASGVTGSAGVDVPNTGGVQNMAVESFTADATTATSIVKIGGDAPTLRVTHFYHPSSSPNLYQADVTIENLSDSAVDLRYRRVMDWDIEPTAFSEFVTIRKGTATDLTFVSNNGFATADPLVPGGNLFSCPVNADFDDCGPADHGALFDFSFGAVDPGGNKQFRIFYGAAANQADAEAALAAVGAEAFSFGQPNTIDGPTLGTPNTFIFAFAGIGGTPVISPAIITTAAEGFNFPFGVAVDNGDIYIADRNNHVVKKLSGEVLTVVAGCSNDSSVSPPVCAPTPSGTGEAGYNGDGISATTAQLNSPTGVAVANGNLFIADSENHIIRMVSGGTITTVAGIPQKNGLAVNGGSATLAELFGPRGVAAVADEAGIKIYIADTMNQQVRMVDVNTGIITAVAGVAGETGPAVCPTLPAICPPLDRLNSPLGVAVDSVGVVYIADEGNDVIRMVNVDGLQTVDAGPLDSPSGVAVDGNGNLYVADTDNHRIQRVSDGVVTTVAGTGTAGFSGDGGAATAATLNAPVAVAVDSTGEFLYIADLINNKIRKVDFTPGDEID